MAQNTFDKRWKENREAWTFNSIQTFGIVLMLLAGVVAVVGYLNQHTVVSISNILSDFYANVSSELISIVITVLVLDAMNARRQDRQELTRLKALLGSNESVVTKIAVAELSAKGWLKDGKLSEAVLWNANLSGANLQSANLEGARLFEANLDGADLFKANLDSADLRHVNLEGATLQSANLEGAILASANLERINLRLANLEEVELWCANLEGAILKFANLRGANLKFANLRGGILGDANLEGACLGGANLEGAILQSANLEGAFLEGVILPDGMMWANDVDMKRFTHEEHPEYEATLERITVIRKRMVQEKKSD